MAGFTTSIRMDAPRERVFEAITDFERIEEVVRGIIRMEVLTEGPVGSGTRFRETRVMFGKECTEEMEISEFDPPHGYTVVCDSHGSTYRSRHTLKDDDGGTTVEISFEVTPLTFGAKLLSPLGKLMAKGCMKALDNDLADIKAAVEGAAQPV